MGIVFDEVVGTVTEGTPRERSDEREEARPPAPALDRDEIARALSLLRRREARLHAD